MTKSCTVRVVQFLVFPLFKSFSQYMDTPGPWTANLDANLAHWKQQTETPDKVAATATRHSQRMKHHPLGLQTNCPDRLPESFSGLGCLGASRRA